MLIGRCAWHTKYRGYPAFSGVRSWRGLWLRFTDGICPECAQRFRIEHRDFLDRRRDAAGGPVGTSDPTAA